MGDTDTPDVLVPRWHQLAVRYSLTVKDMAEKCGIPKSSLEGYMRLKGAKRPGIDAMILIANAFGVSMDWLVGRSDGEQLGEIERRDIALAVFKLIRGVLRDIEYEQLQTNDCIIKDGKIGSRDIEDYSQRLMLSFLSSERLFSVHNFDWLRIIDGLLVETNHLSETARD